MKFTVPHVTVARLIESQREHAANPSPWVIFYQAETMTLCRIERNSAGQIIRMALEGPLTADQAEARIGEILSQPVADALSAPSVVH